MTEDLLHFIWRHQKFESHQLHTVQGEPLNVIHPGYSNQYGGPDFEHAQLFINNLRWIGSVEIHLKASHWYAYHHESDQSYDNVILHVVWEDDVEVCYPNGNRLPTLELQQLVEANFLVTYVNQFKQSYDWIPCEREILNVPTAVLIGWKERLYINRLQEKSHRVESILAATQNDWEATLYRLLARNFGLNVNGEAFAVVAASFPFSVVRKSWHHGIQLEVLFLGQAGLLPPYHSHPYIQQLIEEYEFLSNKFRLKPAAIRMQFARLRPVNFPTIRWVQLAQVYTHKQGLFSSLLQNWPDLSLDWVTQIGVSPFWETHYTFDKQSKKKNKSLSKSFSELLMINTVLPLMFSYFKRQGREVSEELLNQIIQLKAEKNAVVAGYKKLGLLVNNALDSQAFIELKKNYCSLKKCVNCQLGSYMLTH